MIIKDSESPTKFYEIKFNKESEQRGHKTKHTENILAKMEGKVPMNKKTHAIHVENRLDFGPRNQ